MPNRHMENQAIIARGAEILARTPEYKARAASISAEVAAAYAKRIAAADPIRRLWLRWRCRNAAKRAVNAALRPPGALY